MRYSLKRIFLLLSRSGTLKYLFQKEKNSLFIEFRIVWSLSSPESTIFMIFQSLNVLRTTVKNRLCAINKSKNIYRLSSYPEERKERPSAEPKIYWSEGEEWSGKEIPQFCIISGKQKGHLCEVWMRGGMGLGSVCGNFMRHF